jgi:hypothetical protein
VPARRFFQRATHVKRASNLLVAVEDMDEAGLDTLRTFYCKLAALAKEETNVKATHLLDDAEVIHASKSKGMKKSMTARRTRALSKA